MEVLCIPVGPLQANCYLVDDGHGTACIVDPGGEPERLVHALEQRELDLVQILLTHGHFDHMAGTAQLAERTGARVGCSPQVKEMIEDPDRFLLFPGFEGIPGHTPEQLLHDGEQVPVGELIFTTVATPGHGPGDLTFAAGGALFCGDLLFYRSIGRTDFPGGDHATLLASVRRLSELFPPETLVYPGHMQPTTLGAEILSNPFLRGM